MKDDFQRLEDDMNRLNSRMAEISSASNSINGALADRKQQIMKFCGVHHLLKKVLELLQVYMYMHIRVIKDTRVEEC